MMPGQERNKDLSGTGKDGLRPRFLRLGWPLVFLLIVVLNIAGIPDRYREVLATPYTIISKQDSNGPAVIQALDEAGIRLEGFVAYLTSLEVLSLLPYIVFGILIFWFRPNDRGAKLISLLLLLGSSANFLPALLNHHFSIWAIRLLSDVTSLAFTLVFFLFPDGRFVPGWTKWFVVLFELLILPATYFPGSRWDINQSALIAPVAIAIFLIMIYAQVFRYRNVSGPVERLQTRWVAAGLAAFPVLWITNGFLLPALAPSLTVINGQTIRYHILINLLLLQPLTLILPIGIGISLLRYRLYDIDIIIRKTLVYASVTGLLALVYFGSVVLVQSIFAGSDIRQSPAVIVISTLAIAALFNPLRRRVQEAVDRRFYRPKYDAQRTVQTFATTLRVEVDIDELSNHLLSVIQETMKPQDLSLWVGQSGELQKAKMNTGNPLDVHDR
jgi:hypothetical protein